jgi:hypothetical protein
MNFDLARVAESRTVILVEGTSDRAALEALAERRGRALDAHGIAIVQMGGATNIGRFLRLFGLAGSASGWLGCVTPPKRATSGVPSSGLASAPACPAPVWKRSVSTCAPPTWRTS